MRNRFLHRGYPSKTLEQSVEQALQTPRSELLTKRKKDVKPARLCFVSDFNHCSKETKQIILKHWPVLQMEPMLQNITTNPPLFAHRRAPTLRDKLVHSSSSSPDRSTWLSLKGNYRCGRCAQCNNTTNCKFFSHPLTGKKYKQKSFINCNSTNVVYMLTCPCGKAYVGQTKRCLKTRISEHKTAIRTGNIDYSMAKHYLEAQHGSPSSLRFVGLEQVALTTRGGNLPKMLSQREMYWIFELNPMQPQGLNDDFSYKPFL